MSWTKICTTDEVPTSTLRQFWVGVAGGIPLVVAHQKSGFTAMPPVCPHKKEPLAESGVIASCKLPRTKSMVMAFVSEQLQYDFETENDTDDDDAFND